MNLITIEIDRHADSERMSKADIEALESEAWRSMKKLLSLCAEQKQGNTRPKLSKKIKKAVDKYNQLTYKLWSAQMDQKPGQFLFERKIEL